jgi:phospholipase/lecithinase/hemolysin
MAALVLARTAAAGPITQIVVFGDSLSDNGNFHNATGFPPTPPYFNGRLSNGPVAVEYMAQDLGVGASNFSDFAWAGATTGQGNIADGGTATTAVGLPGMSAVFQFELLGGHVPISPTTAYVIWGGPNDFFSMTNPSQLPGTITTAVNNLVTMASVLQSLGAQHIIVPNMPDLGLTPDVASNPGLAALLHQATGEFNAALAAGLPAGVRYVDDNALFLDMFNNPGKFGFTNVTSPCFNGTSVCSTPDQYMFFDGTHPTTVVHNIVGAELAAAAVPEPVSWALLAAGLAALGLVRRARSNAS